MIGWIYSVSWLRSGVTRGGQKLLEGAKTIVDTSYCLRVVTEIVGDDFMQFERHLSIAGVPTRLAATRGIPRVPVDGQRASERPCVGQRIQDSQKGIFP